MTSQNNAGYRAPIVGDEIDKYYLNKLWLSDAVDKNKQGILDPFSAQGGSGGGGDDGGGDKKDKRPQLDDIVKPPKQEIYYENNIAKVKVSIRVYISSEDAVSKFQVKSTLPVSQGGKA